MSAEVVYVAPKCTDNYYVYSVKLVCDGSTCTTVNVQNLSSRRRRIRVAVTSSRWDGVHGGAVSEQVELALESLEGLQLSARDFVRLLPSGTAFDDGFLTIMSRCSELRVAGVYEGVKRPQRVFWYMAPDFNHFIGGLTPVSPKPVLTNAYETVVESVQVLNLPPSGFDVLVLDDVGANFDVSRFEGSTIVTFDSGISPLMYWFTGSLQIGEYWNYGSRDTLNWVNPVEPQEVGANGDARVYSTLDGVTVGGSQFKRRADIIQAYSTTIDNDDIIAYDIYNGTRVRTWVHIGPHFGGYPDPPFYGYTRERLSQLVKYALDVVYDHCPIFPQVPDGDAAATPAAAGGTMASAVAGGEPNLAVL